MTKFLKKNWLKLIISVPISFQIIGIVINNIHLSKYNIIEVYSLKPILLLTGVVFLIINLICFFIFTVGTDIINPENNRLLLLKTLLRGIIIINISFIILSGLDLQDISLGDILIPSQIQLILLSSSVLLFTNKVFLGDLPNKKSGYYYPNAIIRIILSIPMVLIFILLLFKNTNFNLLSRYVLFLSVAFYIFQFARSEVQEESKNPDYKPKFHFTKDGSPIKLDLVFAVFIFLIILIGLTVIYSTSIYKLLPANFGGGKPSQIRVVTEKDIIKGSLIHQNDKNLYIEFADKIKIIKKDEIIEFK